MSSSSAHSKEPAIEPVHDDNTWMDRALDRLRRHRLPPLIEFIAAWGVAAACLVYYGYSYLSSAFAKEDTGKHVRVALATIVRRRYSSRTELVTEIQRLDELIRHAIPVGDATDDRDRLIAHIRKDIELRRNISQFILLVARRGFNVVSTEQQRLHTILDSIWLDLLALPPPDEDNDDILYKYDITLILPAYKEHGVSVARTLRYARNYCLDPMKVQVIVVDAGLCTDLDVHVPSPAPEWGEVKRILYTGKGGRGPCQNMGASHSQGRILTFLHSDTILPPQWDVKVKRALQSSNSTTGRTIHACSFSIGHNVSNEGLDGRPYPWGIRSILFLGNFRAYLFRLPYGDHILSFPAQYFRFLGGFPDQPIMEDYDMMDLLRKRANVLPETLCLIAPPTGLCSVRRWQSLGVTYVTLVNALLVHRFAHGGWTADEVYDYYYRRPFVERKTD